MLYVGVDAHKSTSQFTITNEAGEVLRRKRVASTQEGFQSALAGLNAPLKSVLEASYSWGPMYDWLEEMSEEVLLAHPLKVRAIASARIKNDRIDSEVLTHLLRTNLIPTAHAPSREIRALRRILRQRMFLIQVRTMLRNRVRALLAQHSVKLPDDVDLYTRSGRAWLEGVQLPGSDAQLLRASRQHPSASEIDRRSHRQTGRGRFIDQMARQRARHRTFSFRFDSLGNRSDQPISRLQTFCELYRPGTLYVRLQFSSDSRALNQAGEQVAAMGFYRSRDARRAVLAFSAGSLLES